MASRRVTFTFTQETIAEPIIYTLAQQYRVITNIRRADLAEDRGWVTLELQGEEEDIEAGIAWVTSKGIRVEPMS